MFGGGACPYSPSEEIICTGPVSPPLVLPPRFRLFRDSERHLVERSMVTLEASDFYWGPLPTVEAHTMLSKETTGSFLVRDSSQGNHLFSVSIKIDSGPVSVRMLFFKGQFWLRELCSECPVKLLEMAVEKTKHNPLCCQNGIKLVLLKPLRRTRCVTLQQLCRKCIVSHYGRDGISRLSMQPALRRFIDQFPFKI